MNGWLNIYKPRDINSSKVVYSLRKKLNIKKIGHAGTLDPLAEGVLPIAVGEATKLTGYLIDARKEYHFTIQFGKQTSTGDMEGEVINTCDSIVAQTQLEQVIEKFIGKITQIPSKYSAIKVKGVRSYKLARAGADFEVPSREVEIFKLQLLSFDEEKQVASLICECSKGTYIRTLAEDIAFCLQNLAHVIVLKRSKVGSFSLEQSLAFDKLDVLNSDDISNYSFNIDFVLDDIPVINVDEITAQKIRFGQSLKFDLPFAQIYRIYNNSKIVAIGYINAEGIFNINRVFNI